MKSSKTSALQGVEAPETKDQVLGAPKTLSASSRPTLTGKEDPADTDVFDILGIPGLRLITPKPVTGVETSAYLDVVDTIYDELVSKDKFTGSLVSRSMLHYYAGALLHQRMLNVTAGERLGLVLESQDFNTAMGSPCIPKALAHLLNQIGSVADVNGRQWQVDWNVPDQDWQVLTGTYGRVGPDTHWEYAAYPAPAVLAMSVVADLCYSDQPDQFPVNWDLPPELRPQEDNAGLPTRNLLGWKPAERLTQEVSEMLREFGVDCAWDAAAHAFVVNEFGEHRAYFNYNKALIDHVSEVLRGSGLPRVEQINLGFVGSQTLLPFSVLAGNQRPHERGTMGDVSTRSYTQLPVNRCSGATVARLRLRRDSVPGNLVYTWDDAPPNAWYNTINGNYARESYALLEDECFASMAIRGREATKAFVLNVGKR